MTAIVDRVEIAYRALRQAIIEQRCCPAPGCPRTNWGVTSV